MQLSNNPADKTIFNRLSQQLKREIQEIKNETVDSYLRELTDHKNTKYSLWKARRKLKRPIAQMPPIGKEEGR